MYVKQCNMTAVLNFESMQKGSVVCLRNYFIIGDKERVINTLSTLSTLSLMICLTQLSVFLSPNNGLYLRHILQAL
jgi:hypothetical protein